MAGSASVAIDPVDLALTLDVGAGSHGRFVVLGHTLDVDVGGGTFGGGTFVGRGFPVGDRFGERLGITHVGAVPLALDVETPASSPSSVSMPSPNTSRSDWATGIAYTTMLWR